MENFIFLCNELYYFLTHYFLVFPFYTLWEGQKTKPLKKLFSISSCNFMLAIEWFHNLKVVNYFRKMLRLRCLTGFSIGLCGTNYLRLWNDVAENNGKNTKI